MTNRRWIGVTLAAAALAGGCGTSGPSRPGEIDAGWDSVTLSSAPSNDALSVLGDGKPQGVAAFDLETGT